MAVSRLSSPSLRHAKTTTATDAVEAARKKEPFRRRPISSRYFPLCRPSLTAYCDYCYIGLLLTLAASLFLSQDDVVLAATKELHHPGATTFKLQRGQVLGKEASGKDLFRAYQEIQQDYQQKAFSNNTPWRTLTTKEGVQVKILHHPSDPTCPYVQMKAVFPTSLQDCWDFLQLDKWDTNMKIMDPFYEGVSILGEYRHGGAHMLLARKRTQRILAFGKRDFVFVSVSDKPMSDGTWVSGTVSVISDQVPRYQQYTRAYQDSIAFYKPLGPETTELTIVCRIDLNDHAEEGEGGAMPMWLYVKTIGSTGARSVISMRNHLVKQVLERRARQNYVHKRERKWHEEMLPRMEWGRKKAVHVATAPTPIKTSKPAFFGIDWIRTPRVDEVDDAEEGITDEEKEGEVEVESLRSKLHRAILPFMEWPVKKSEKKLQQKKKTLKQKLHELILPWMEW